jgi:hypothetical protein
MPIFVPCPACARHIATTEKACPFCASLVAEDLASRAVPSANKRLSRQALFAFAATALAANGLAVSSCSGSVHSSYGFPGCDDCGAQTFGDAGAGFAEEDSAGSFDAYFPDDSAIDASIDDADAADEDAD